MSNDEMEWDDLHPHTQRILSRRGFLGTAGTAAASVTFLGLTMTVTGCSSSSDTSTGAGTTKAGGSTGTSAAGSTGTTAAKTYGTGKPGSLYNELGGHAAIEAVMGLFLTNVAADTVINKRFANTNIDNLKQQLVDFVGSATGGPETYTGLSMEKAHAGMNITVEEFNALVGDLGKAMTTAKVSDAVQAKVVEALAPLQPQIVGK